MTVSRPTGASKGAAVGLAHDFAGAIEIDCQQWLAFVDRQLDRLAIDLARGGEDDAPHAPGRDSRRTLNVPTTLVLKL